MAEQTSVMTSPADQPVTAIAWYNRAIARRDQGRPAEAMAAFRCALVLRPDFPQAWTNLAIALVGAERLAEALVSLSHVTALTPQAARAHTNLGVVLIKAGRFEEGIAAQRAAIRCQPELAEAYANLADALRAHGAAAAASLASRCAIVLSPGTVEAWLNGGAALHDGGNHAAALHAAERAIRSRPASAEAHYNRGLALKGLGRRDDAVVAYRVALALRPAYAETLNTLGIALKAQAAMTALRQGLALRPRWAEAWNNLAVLLLDQGDLEQTIAACHQALAVRPDYPEAHANLGIARTHQGAFADAILAARLALALKPDFVAAANNLAIALLASRDTGSAMVVLRQALTVVPEHPATHYNRSLVALQQGDFETGWADYEWRWKGGAPYAQPRAFAVPAWEGETLEGRTLLVHAEQGLGDTLQFLRFLPDLIAAGGRVVIECQQPLKRLVAGQYPYLRVVATGESLPAFDCHLPLMSAPYRLRTTLATLPAPIPYVEADPMLADVWRQRLSGVAGPKVGLVWAGNPRTTQPSAAALDRRRSLPLTRLEPVLAVPGVHFVSLQKDRPAREIDDLPQTLRPFDPMRDVVDFADTAAIVANLDLVIAVDSAVAHLAGAMGKPVWMLSRFDGCWRWLQDRDDSPWYPTLRLFRQTTPGDWGPVIARVVEALRAWSKIPNGCKQAEGVWTSRI